jgi:hypothetical protein
VRRALRAMAANAGLHDQPRTTVRPCHFGINSCAVGAAASVFHYFLTAPGGEGDRPSEAPAPRRRKAG